MTSAVIERSSNAASLWPMLLTVRDLGVVYPNGVRALAQCSLAVRRGEFVALLGPSGSGKSTLLRAINRLVEPIEGEVALDGLGSSHTRTTLRQLRARVAMVFQQHQLIGRLSALANVLTGRLGRHSGLRTLAPLPRADRLAALAALDQVGLVEYALTRCDQLSGGQQQRVGIARALAQEPALILADEPVASLDPASAERVLALLQNVCRANGIAAIVSLHQLELARRFGDRVVALSGGRVVFDAPPAQLDGAACGRIYGAAPTAAALAIAA